jgi:hypothetical protein
VRNAVASNFETSAGSATAATGEEPVKMSMEIAQMQLFLRDMMITPIAVVGTVRLTCTRSFERSFQIVCYHIWMPAPRELPIVFQGSWSKWPLDRLDEGEGSGGLLRHAEFAKTFALKHLLHSLDVR